MKTSTRSTLARKAVLALGAAVIATAATMGAAQAKPAFGFSLHLGGHAPHVGFYYDAPHYSPCHWLKKKAYKTGSPYWWKKYKKCLWKDH